MCYPAPFRLRKAEARSSSVQDSLTSAAGANCAALRLALRIEARPREEKAVRSLGCWCRSALLVPTARTTWQPVVKLLSVHAHGAQKLFAKQLTSYCRHSFARSCRGQRLHVPLAAVGTLIW